MTDDTFFDQEVAFDAAQIEAVRMLLKQFPQLGAFLGSIQTFKMVIDVNMVARELKRRFQSYGEPILTKHLVKAGILQVHFPKWGEIELEGHGAFQRAPYMDMIV